MEFDWDEANEEHIARHGVSRIETEAVLLDPFALFLDDSIEDGEIRFRQVGSTTRGKLIIVAFTLRGDAVRPITAFDADRFTARLYREELFQ